MDQKSDLIKEDIDETRSALTTKLVTLEDEIRDRVETAKGMVEDTIENVKSSIRKFSPTHQVHQHPFAMVGGSAAIGLLMGRAANGARARREADFPVEAESVPQKPAWRGPSLLERLADRFSDEIHMVEGMAVGAALNTVRDVVKGALPSFGEQIDQVCDSALAKVEKEGRLV